MADHPWEDLAKSGYKPNMKYESLIIKLYFSATNWKPNVEISQFLLIFFSLVAIENFQIDFIFIF